MKQICQQLLVGSSVDKSINYFIHIYIINPQQAQFPFIIMKQLRQFFNSNQTNSFIKKKNTQMPSYSSEGPSSEEFYLSQINQEYFDEEYEQLIARKQELENQILHNPNNPNLVFNLAKIQAELGQIDKCENHLQICIDLKPKSKKKYLNAFEDILSKKGKKQQLLEFYQKQIRDSFNSQYYKYSRAELLQDLGRYEEAENQFIECIKENPKDEDIYTAYGLMLLKMGRDADSEEVIKRGYMMNPFNQISRNSLGNLYVGKQEQECEPMDEKLIKSHLEVGKQDKYLDFKNILKERGQKFEKKDSLQRKIDETMESNTDAVLLKKMEELQTENKRLKTQMGQKDQRLFQNLAVIRKNNRVIEDQKARIRILEHEKNQMKKELQSQNALLKKQLERLRAMELRRKQNAQNIGLCKFCINKKASIIFIECGHLCLCRECSEIYNKDECIMCRGPSKRQNVYNSTIVCPDF